MLFLRPFIARRAMLLRSQRRYASQKPAYQPPAAAEEVNPHRAYYQSWGLPVVKVFLGALLTYQVIYLSWLKLEQIEQEHVKNDEIKVLEGRLTELSGSKDFESK